MALVKFILWRRPLDGEGLPWTKLPGEYATHTAAMEAVSQAELTAGVGEFTYTIMLLGQTPAIYPQTYRHRMMRPQP